MMDQEKFPALSLKQSCYFDLMRFIAVQLVVIGHLLSFMNIIVFPNYALGIQIPIQNLGVVVFFILSGYLISYSLYNNLTFKEYSFSNFFKDRFFRIYVTLIPCLLLIAVLDSLMPHYQYAGAFNLKTFIGNLFMLQDISYSLARYAHWESVQNLIIPLQITSFGSARPLWTLGVEWWLYMAFGWYVLNIMNRKTRLITKLSQLAIFWLLLIVPVNHLIGRGNGLTLAWLSGAFIFFTVYYQKITLHLSRFWFITGNLICLYLFTFLYFNLSTFYDPRISILTAIWFTLNLAFSNTITVTLPNKLKLLLIRVIRIAGGYSYALYLLHYTIIQFYVNSYGIIENKYFTTFMAFASSNLAAFVIYTLFDKHHKKIQNQRFFNSTLWMKIPTRREKQALKEGV